MRGITTVNVRIRKLPIRPLILKNPLFPKNPQIIPMSGKSQRSNIEKVLGKAMFIKNGRI